MNLEIVILKKPHIKTSKSEIKTNCLPNRLLLLFKERNALCHCYG